MKKIIAITLMTVAFSASAFSNNWNSNDPMNFGSSAPWSNGGNFGNMNNGPWGNNMPMNSGNWGKNMPMSNGGNFGNMNNSPWGICQ